MAISGVRKVYVNLTGDYVAEMAFSAATNAASPGAVTTYTLSSGNNQIDIPVGFTVTGATILPPSGNTQALLLKGTTAGDAGMPIHPTDPTSIGIPSTLTTHFHLNAAGTVTGLRVVWT